MTSDVGGSGILEDARRHVLARQRVEGVGFRGLGFQDLGCRASGFRVSGFGVEGLGV